MVPRSPGNTGSQNATEDEVNGHLALSPENAATDSRRPVMPHATRPLVRAGSADHRDARRSNETPWGVTPGQLAERAKAAGSRFAVLRIPLTGCLTIATTPEYVLRA